MKALVVASAPHACEVVGEALRSRGHDVTVRHTLEDAWQEVARADADLLLLDWPGRQGSASDLCRRVRASPEADVEIVALIAPGDPGGIRAALDAGADDYLDTSSPPEDLEARLLIAATHAARRRHRRPERGARPLAEEHGTQPGAGVFGGVVATDLEGIITLATQRAATLLGYHTPSEVVGRRLTDHLEPPDRERAAAHLARLATGQAGDDLYPVRRTDGSSVTLEISSAHAAGPHEPPSSCVAVVREGSLAEAEGIAASASAGNRAIQDRAALAVERLTRFQDVTAGLAAALTRAEITQVVVKHGVAALGAYAGVVVLRAGDQVDIIAAVGYPADHVEAYQSFPLETPVPLAEAIRTGKAIWIASAAEWIARYPRMAPLVRSASPGTAAVLPLIGGGGPLGAIGLSFPVGHPVEHGDHAFLQALARQCAQALERARLFEDEQRARVAAQEAEQRLRQSEERYRLIVETATEGIWMLGSQDTTTFVNRQMARLLGYEPAEMLGRPVYDFMDETIQPQVRASLARRRAGLSERFEFVYRRKDGTSLWTHVATQALWTERGDYAGALAMVGDITARRRAEAQLRRQAAVQTAVTEMTVLAASDLDAEALFPRLCSAAAAAFALDRAAIWLSEGPETLRLAATVGTVAQVGVQAPVSAPTFVAGRAVRERRAVVVDSLPAPQEGDGVLAEYRGPLVGHSVLAAPLLVGARVVGALSFASARTDAFGEAEAAAAEQIAQAVSSALHNARLFALEREVTARLQALDRWRADFLRVMAHQLRTPLGHVLGFSDLLSVEEERLSLRGQRSLNNLRAGALRLQDLVERVLELLRLSSDGVTFAHEAVSLTPLVDDVIAAHSARTQHRGLTLAWSAPAPSPVVSGDLQLLRRALTVMLDNAVTYTPEGGRISVLLEQGGESARIAVRNTGPGVPDDVRHAFVAGAGHPLLMRQDGSVGLGLLLARRIAHLHGGDLHLEAPGECTCFVLTLPLATGVPMQHRDCAS